MIHQRIPSLSKRLPFVALLLLPCALLAGPSSNPVLEPVDPNQFPFEGSLSAGWDSLYVSEGRDNLDGDSLFGTTLELGYGGLTFGTWYADSPEGTYNELNLWVEYGIEIGAFELYAGYTHLRFPDDNDHDNEAGVGIAYTGLPWGIVPAVDWYHSFAADGSFIEVSVVKTIEPAEWLTLEPGVVVGFNENYIDDGHDGANHVALSLAAAIPLAEAVELTGYVSYNWAIDADPTNAPGDELLEDFFYGGVALSISF